MRILGLTILALTFMGTPVLLLDTLVLPELTELQYTYSHLDEIAQSVVEQ